MKNLTITFFVVLMLIISSACERIIEPNELPQQDPQVVVNCIVYSGSAITASITLSKSILSGKPYKTVDNAVCDVYENDNYVGKLTAAGSGNYTSSIVAQTGKKYELKVSAPGYDGVSGSTSVPDQLSVTNIERYDTTNYAITTYTYNNGMGTSTNIGGSLKLKLRIVDNEPKVKNYYSLFAAVILYDTSGTSMSPEYSYVYSNTENSGTDIISDGTSIEFTDETLVNGNQVPVDVTVSFGKELPEDFTLRNVEVVFFVTNFSAEYYRYYVTLKKQAYAAPVFFAEPAQVYSNMSNGMGIFAGGNNQTAVKVYP